MKNLTTAQWRRQARSKFAIAGAVLSFVVLAWLPLLAQTRGPARATPKDVQAAATDARATTKEWNGRLRERASAAETTRPPREYRIGSKDLLEITVFDAPDLNRSVRVAKDGGIRMPLIGTVKAVALTPRELGSVLEELLRRKHIMKDPQVNVFVSELQSHPVSVFGAVARPGVLQIRDSKTLLEVLSLAGGLAQDAGDTVIVMRAAGASGTSDPSQEQDGNETGADASQTAIEVDLKALLESGDSRSNVEVYPGDIVKVTRAGVVYVVGEVRRPGGFVLQSNEDISVLQALAMAEGLTPTAKKQNSVIIRTGENGARSEIPINLDEILKRKAPDQYLQTNDVVFIPSDKVKAGFMKALDVVVGAASRTVVYRPARR